MKYNDGFPADSRLGSGSGPPIAAARERFNTPEGKAELAKVKLLSEFAEKGALLGFCQSSITISNCPRRTWYEGHSPGPGMGGCTATHVYRHPGGFQAGAGPRQHQSP